MKLCQPFAFTFLTFDRDRFLHTFDNRVKEVRQSLLENLEAYGDKLNFIVLPDIRARNFLLKSQEERFYSGLGKSIDELRVSISAALICLFLAVFTLFAATYLSMLAIWMLASVLLVPIILIFALSLLYTYFSLNEIIRQPEMEAILDVAAGLATNGCIVGDKGVYLASREWNESNTSLLVCTRRLGFQEFFPPSLDKHGGILQACFVHRTGELAGLLTLPSSMELEAHKLLKALQRRMPIRQRLA